MSDVELDALRVALHRLHACVAVLRLFPDSFTTDSADRLLAHVELLLALAGPQEDPPTMADVIRLEDHRRTH